MTYGTLTDGEARIAKLMKLTSTERLILPSAIKVYAEEIGMTEAEFGEMLIVHSWLRNTVADIIRGLAKTGRVDGNLVASMLTAGAGQ